MTDSDDSKKMPSTSLLDGTVNTSAAVPGSTAVTHSPNMYNKESEQFGELVTVSTPRVIIKKSIANLSTTAVSVAVTKPTEPYTFTKSVQEESNLSYGDVSTHLPFRHDSTNGLSASDMTNEMQSSSMQGKFTTPLGNVVVQSNDHNAVKQDGRVTSTSTVESQQHSSFTMPSARHSSGFADTTDVVSLITDQFSCECLCVD